MTFAMPIARRPTGPHPAKCILQQLNIMILYLLLFSRLCPLALPSFTHNAIVVKLQWIAVHLEHPVD